MVGRRRRYGGKWCGVTTAVVFIVSMWVLFSRRSSDVMSVHDDSLSLEDPLLLQDSDPLLSTISSDDRIDELDFVDDDSSTLSNEEELLRSLDSDADDYSPPSSSGYYFDHLSLVIRHAFDRPSIDDLHRWDYFGKPFLPSITFDLHPPLLAFASDDFPVDEDLKTKLLQVTGIEDALLLKLPSRVSPLRQGWGPWFDAKSDFLRKDKMLKSNLELLNPFNHFLLQDPDVVAVTPLTRGDKLLQKGLLTQMKKPLILEENTKVDQQASRRTLDGGERDEKQMKKLVDVKMGGGGGQRWGYFPGLPPYLSFSNFMDYFFRKSKCSIRVFMVWNSPSWMFTIRHQRALESLLHHHPNACLVIFSETIELDFFKDFVKDSFKVAVAMPNLEELLQDTPTSIFASVWHEWRKTRFYSLHYSELIRLAALYKYGGIYLDCDVVVLKPISPFSNSVGMEESSPDSPLNGAVMAFTKHSSFLMQCMSEFYSTYDDTLKRWNGAELLTRVVGNFSRKATDSDKQQELKVQPASIFFPISSYDIQRYFFSPLNDSEKVHQDSLFKKIINESYTFHFWNSVTSAIVPEPDSLVARILNHYCTRCSDLL